MMFKFDYCSQCLCRQQRQLGIGITSHSSVCLSVFLSVHLSIRTSVYLSDCQLILPSGSPSYMYCADLIEQATHMYLETLLFYLLEERE